MEGEDPKGNPSTASSHSLPPQAEAVSPADEDDSQQQPTESLSNTKLCGYLLKQGGPLKSWKWRWFTYEEKKSQLFYYRTAQDVTSLGRIELCSATFGYPLHGEQGTFHIQTPERTFVLKVMRDPLTLFFPVTSCNVDDFLPTVKTPPGLLGEEAANLPAPQQRAPLSNFSLKHPLIEIQLDGLNSLFTSHPAPGSTLSSSSSPSPIQELVWLLHKALEAAQLEKRTCTEFLAAECEQERLELLRHRERQAADLQGRLEELKAEAEGLRASLAQRDAHVAELQENITLMMAKNHSKQEVILKLSEQVAACMADPRRTMSTTNGLEALTFHQLQEDTENLKDDIEAYKIQNKFLNSEIYQLTKLWRNSSEQEKSLMVKCAYLEARNCQIESRYLGVLRKLQESNALEPGQREAVRNLIEDALKGDLNDVLELNPVREHDEYGFKIIPDYEVEDMKLLAKIQALEIRSHNLLRQEAGVRPLLDRWAQYMGGRPADDLCPSPELKFLLRCGVPREYRPRVWRWVVRARTRSLRERHPDRYEQLCQKSLTSPHQASRQIQLDLHRTLTTNQRFSSPSSPTLQQLQRILLAFSWQNPTIGYCQGLNRLAAIVLLVLESEEDAFWCLVAVVETIMPQDYYTKTLIASQVDQRVLKDFMAEKMPRLTAHFEEHSVDVSLITFSWFLVVFVESLPSDILLRVWDAFLYEGTKVIFRYALALFKYKEEDILNIHDNVEIYQYLRFFTKTISDGRKLTNIAFSDMNPFPMKLLKNRRALHLERLQGELRELEAQQREFVTESAERKDKDLDTILVSEDDEDL
uniref:TBC1 domain family member 2 n=1 Tax=Salmo trutta TaxID=8032 RepID=A0A673WME5_SALTR